MPGLFQDFPEPPKRFTKTLSSPSNAKFRDAPIRHFVLDYRQTAVTYSVYTVWQYNPSQNVHHKLQRNYSVKIQ